MYFIRTRSTETTPHTIHNYVGYKIVHQNHSRKTQDNDPMPVKRPRAVREVLLKYFTLCVISQLDYSFANIMPCIQSVSHVS